MITSGFHEKDKNSRKVTSVLEAPAYFSLPLLRTRDLHCSPECLPYYCSWCRPTIHLCWFLGHPYVVTQINSIYFCMDALLWQGRCLAKTP